MSRTCCNHNCRQSDDCPLRQPRDLTSGERLAGLFLVLMLVILLASSLAGCHQGGHP